MPTWDTSWDCCRTKSGTGPGRRRCRPVLWSSRNRRLRRHGRYFFPAWARTSRTAMGYGEIAHRFAGSAGALRTNVSGFADGFRVGKNRVCGGIHFFCWICGIVGFLETEQRVHVPFRTQAHRRHFHGQKCAFPFVQQQGPGRRRVCVLVTVEVENPGRSVFRLRPGKVDLRPGLRGRVAAQDAFRQDLSQRHLPDRDDFFLRSSEGFDPSLAAGGPGHEKESLADGEKNRRLGGANWKPGWIRRAFSRPTGTGEGFPTTPSSQQSALKRPSCSHALHRPEHPASTSTDTASPSTGPGPSRRPPRRNTSEEMKCPMDSRWNSHLPPSESSWSKTTGRTLRKEHHWVETWPIRAETTVTGTGSDSTSPSGASRTPTSR